MIRPEQIKSFFPPYLREEPAYQKYMLKEYIQVLILDYLATTVFIRKIVLIGGPNLRLIRGIDRLRILPFFHPDVGYTILQI